MKNQEYYVYGLIDPRDNQYFYIGKGKGKRYLSHLKPKKFDLNFQKNNRIKEIQEIGLEVKIEILFPNLDENTAFELERIVVYKLGREAFAEGILTNIAPGGQWKPGDNMFYAETYQPNFDINKLDFVAQLKFNEIPILSEFDYLNTSKKEQIIYKYNLEGVLEKSECLTTFFSYDIEGKRTYDIRGRQIELIKAIRENDLPVYSHYSIYSKYKYDNLYISKKIPFEEFDVIDERFNKDFDKRDKESNKFIMKFFVGSVLRLKLEKDNDIISLFSFYPLGNKKALKKVKDKEQNETAYYWFKNGNLRMKKELLDNNQDFIRTSYYESGKLFIRTNRTNKNEISERWFENGNKKIEFKKDIGYIHYNEAGKKIKIDYLFDENIEEDLYSFLSNQH